MKRLLIAVCALAALAFQGAFFPQAAAAAAKAPAVDAGAIVGMAEPDLVAVYGSPARMEPSEYGFTWYVYNRDYRNFFMAGVRDGAVVAVYTNARTMAYNGAVQLNSTRASVRKALGKPVSYFRNGNVICVLNNAKQKDVIPVGDHYVIVFYDLIKGGKVTSMLVVPRVDEENALMNHPELNEELTAAYARISIDLINAVRVRGGLKKLATDEKNMALALSRSADMRDRNYFSHYTPEKVSPFTQAKRMGIKYSSMGENIAFGDHNAILAHEAFMNSKGHRNNVLKAKYTKVGAGVAWGSKRYVLLTNIFTR